MRGKNEGGGEEERGRGKKGRERRKEVIVDKGREDEKDNQDYILTSPVRQRSY